MKTEFILKKLVVGVSILLLSASCETEDIFPALELSASDTNLSEASGTLTISATLNAAATQQITVPLAISGTATQSSDYSVSASEITIDKGSESGSITLTGLQDENVEGVETLVVRLGYVQNVLVLSVTEIEISVLDDDSDSDADGVLDAADSCPNEAGEIENNGCPWLGFLINEVHYDPASDLSGDANADGVRSANDDEFIEFFNSGPELDLSGYTVSDAAEVRHTFPAGTIVPKNGVLVLFGGGSPNGDFGNAIVQTANGFDSRLNLNNSGDSITVTDPSVNVLLTYSSQDTGINHGSNQSISRSPDLTGDFILHSDAAEASGTLFSPGTRLDGSSF